MIYKRGKTYWFNFKFKGVHYQESTKQGNAKKARDLEAKFRANLVDRRAGIEPDKANPPTLAEFEAQFIAKIGVDCKDHPETIDFYMVKYAGLLKFKPLANARLDQIDDLLIDQFKAHLDKLGRQPSTINRHLATLRRALRQAQRWKIINGVPKFDMMGGEHEREFVLTREDQSNYFENCPEFLRNWAMLALETGMRRKELLNLKWSDIHWEPVGRARRGYIHVRGTKSKNSKRNLSLSATAAMVLERQRQISQCEWVFVKDTDHTEQASISALAHAHEMVRDGLELPKDFVLHSLRHSFGTRLAEAGVDAFTIMKLMGHATITTSQIYVHPGASTMEDAVLAVEQVGEKSANVLEVTTNFTTVETAANVKVQ